MKISITTDYALRAMFELAQNYEGECLHIDDIAKKQGIPKRYLEQILLTLKNIGLLTSFRGKEGGYSLAKHPGQVKVLEIVQAIEGALNFIPGQNGKRGDVVSQCWLAAQESVIRTFDSMTLENLVNRKKQKDAVLNYSI